MEYVNKAFSDLSHPTHPHFPTPTATQVSFLQIKNTAYLFFGPFPQSPWPD